MSETQIGGGVGSSCSAHRIPCLEADPRRIEALRSLDHIGRLAVVLLPKTTVRSAVLNSQDTVPPTLPPRSEFGGEEDQGRRRPALVDQSVRWWIRPSVRRRRQPVRTVRYILAAWPLPPRGPGRRHDQKGSGVVYGNTYRPRRTVDLAFASWRDSTIVISGLWTVDKASDQRAPAGPASRSYTAQEFLPNHTNVRVTSIGLTRPVSSMQDNY